MYARAQLWDNCIHVLIMVMVMAVGARLHVKCRNPGRETVFPFGVALHVQLSAQLSDLLANLNKNEMGLLWPSRASEVDYIMICVACSTAFFSIFQDWRNYNAAVNRKMKINISPQSVYCK